ncbi:MAG: hypothetical protein COB15_05525 [Flavobacteriales bacterium]|nr:MAG: hypothetical protein COB15_05525 [Flavobacteriales bacterium]
MRKIILFIVLTFFGFIARTQVLTLSDSVVFLNDSIDNLTTKVANIKDTLDDLKEDLKPIFDIHRFKDAFAKNGGKDTSGTITITNKPIKVHYCSEFPLYILNNQLKNRITNKIKYRTFSYELDSQDINLFNRYIKNKKFKLSPNAVSSDSLDIGIKWGLFRKNITIKQYKTDTLKNVTLNINQDRIQNISIKVSERKPFFTSKSPIPFYSLKKSKSTDKLENKNHEYIYATDVLEDYSPTNFKYQVHLDSTYSKIKPGSKITLYDTKDINHFINYSIYSDLPSLLNKGSNGLIELKFDGSLILNRKNHKNKRLYWLRDLSGNFKLAKIDSEFSVIERKESNNK